MTKLSIRSALGVMLCLSATAAFGEVVAIQGGDLYTITDGVLRGGTLVIEDGKIGQIGRSVTVPEGATVIDATGKCVMPGLVAAEFSGLVSGDPGKISDELDAYHVNVSFALASGVTAGYIEAGARGSGPIGGVNGVVKMTKGDLDGMLVREPVALNVRYSTDSPRLRAQLRRELARASEYLREKAQYDKDKAAGKNVEEPKQPGGIGAALQLIRRELPARVSTRTANDILCALELTDEFGVQLILDGVIEGWTVAEEIAKRDADVIMAPRRMSGEDEEISAPSGSSPRHAAILRQAGVRLAILPVSTSFSTGGGFGDDLFTLPLDAAYAVGGGLPEEAALEAITLRPAEILGVADRLGSLQVGKDADVIVLDGHPLHYATLVDITIVDGKVLYERAKEPYFAHIRPQEPPVEEEGDGEAGLEEPADDEGEAEEAPEEDG